MIQAGHLPTEPGWWITSWCYWFGGQQWDGDAQITATSPEMVRTMDWIQSYARKYGVENMRSFGASFGNFSSPQNPFLSGQVAMVLQGVWMYNFIDKYAPQMEWGAAPFPAMDPSKTPLVTIAECDVLVIPHGARHPREAFEFIRYVNTRGPMEKLALGQRKFSPLISVSPSFVSSHPNPFIRTFIELARSPHALTVPATSIWSEYEEELRVAVNRVMSLEATSGEALAEVQKRMQLKLDRVLRRWNLVKDTRTTEWRDYDPR